jgi:hypothetical protein
MLLPPHVAANPACGYRPRARYVGGPLDGKSAAPLRRKTGPVHPLFRTSAGKTVAGAPGAAHYYLRGTGWEAFYEFTDHPAAQPHPHADGGCHAVSCTACSWSAPAFYHRGLGPPGRPAAADAFEALAPAMAEHMHASGHQLRLVLTTWWPLERSVIRIDSRQ